MAFPGRARGAFLALHLAFLFLAPGCSPAPKPPNLVLVTIDTLRADRVGAREAGGSPLTPEIDRFMAGGVRFANAFSQTNITNPSHVSILSGLFPKNHGVYDNSTRASKQVVTLAERLSRRGYRTAGFVSAFHLQALPGLERGFDAFPEPSAAEVKASEAVGRALDWLSRSETRERPFFLWVHLYDPHRPYLPPEDLARKFLHDPARPVEEIEAELARAFERKREEVLADEGADEETVKSFLKEWKKSGKDPAALEKTPVESVDPKTASVIRTLRARRTMLEGGPFSGEEKAEMTALYDAEVASADRELGRLFSVLREPSLGHETFVVLTADHGENLGEHGLYFHHRGIYDTTLHVPLAVVGPAPAVAAPGRIVETAVQSVDIVPTALDLLGLDPSPDVDGISLAPALRGESDPRPPRTLFHENSYALARAVREGRFKLVEPIGSPPAKLRNELRNVAALYDTSRDPGESNDVGDAESDTRERLSRKLREFTALPCRFPLGADAKKGLTPEALERLRKLGYVY